jgi:hypothetical protein
MSDGNWLEAPKGFSNHLYRIVGSRAKFTPSSVTGYPNFYFGQAGLFGGYGVIAVGDMLYSAVSRTQTDAWSQGPFGGVKLLKSTDQGRSWSRVHHSGAELRYQSADDPRRILIEPGEFFSGMNFTEFAEMSGRHRLRSGILFKRGASNQKTKMDVFMFMHRSLFLLIDLIWLG